MQIIGASIDLSKIDKTKIVEGKNGAKYYDFTVIVNDEPNKYGKDVSICQTQTKEQREAKEQRIYIGGGKTVFKSQTSGGVKESTDKPITERSGVSSHGTTTRNGITTDDGDLPF